VTKVFKVQTERLDSLVPTVILVCREHLGKLDLQVPLVSKELQEPLGRQESRDQQDHKDHKDQQASQSAHE